MTTGKKRGTRGNVVVALLLVAVATAAIGAPAHAQYTRTVHAKFDLLNASDHVIVVTAHGPYLLQGYPLDAPYTFTDTIVQVVPVGERFLAMTKDRIRGGHSRHYTLNTFLAVDASGKPLRKLPKNQKCEIGPQTARFDVKCKENLRGIVQWHQEFAHSINGADANKDGVMDIQRAFPMQPYNSGGQLTYLQSEYKKYFNPFDAITTATFTRSGKKDPWVSIGFLVADQLLDEIDIGGLNTMGGLEGVAKRVMRDAAKSAVLGAIEAEVDGDGAEFEAVAVGSAETAGFSANDELQEGVKLYESKIGATKTTKAVKTVTKIVKAYEYGKLAANITEKLIKTGYDTGNVALLYEGTLSDIGAKMKRKVRVRIPSGTTMGLGYDMKTRVLNAKAWGADHYIWTGDFNGDGYDDLASAAGFNIYVMLGNKSGGSHQQTWQVRDAGGNLNAQWGGAEWTKVGDFNNDGCDDIASGHGVHTFMKLGHPTRKGFLAENWANNGRWGTAGYLQVGDFNGDGCDDLASPHGAMVYLKLGGGAPSQQRINNKGREAAFENRFKSADWTVTGTWGGAGYTFVGDFNGDGCDDIASGHGNKVYVKFGGATKFFSHPGVPHDGHWGSWPYTFVGDFNGDGSSDIASGYENLVFMKLGTAARWYSERWRHNGHWGSGAYTWAGDFDGDGCDDIASAKNYQVFMKFGRKKPATKDSNGIRWNDLPTTTWAADKPWGSARWTRIGDFNGDRRADIITGVGTKIYIRLGMAKRQSGT